MRRAWLLGVVLAVSVAGAAGLWRFGRVSDVAVVDAVTGRVEQRVGGPGTVQARVPLTLSARVTATVLEVRADVGDAVRRGQEVAVLDDRDLQARRGAVGGQQAASARLREAARATVDKARAEVDLARARHARDAELLRTGFLSPAALDASDAAVKAAAATLENARATQAARDAEAHGLAHEARYADAMLSFTRITAPTDAVVIARLVEPGTTVVPGTPLLRLVDPATVWVAMRVDESVVGRIEPGQRARIRLRTGETVGGAVARIARQSDAATRELEVNVVFDTLPARFAIDQEAEVSVAVGEATGIVVPAAALARDREGRMGVFVVSGGRTAFRAVATGASDGTRVLVAHGLAGRESIVARAEGITAGMRVRPTTPAPTAPPAEDVAWTSR